MVTRPRNLPQADPYFDSVVLLAPFSGENGDTTSTDLSNDANALTFNGSAALDGDIRKYGFTSLECDGAVTFSTQALVDAGMATGDWTVEFWYRPDGTASVNDRLFQSRNGDLVAGIYIAHEQFNANQIGFGYDINGSTPWDYLSGGTAVTANTWYHIALVRNGSDFRLYLDGTSVANTTYAGSIYLSGSDTCVIGAQTVGSTRANSGWIENFRITSLARYTAAFTPPERAYSTTRTFATVPRGSLENPALPDITELSLDSTNLLPVESTGSLGAVWNDDGTQVWIPDASWTSDVYTTSTAYDASSLTHATSEQIGDISIQRAGRVATDGTLLYLQDYNSTRCNSYTLSTAYDFSSLTFNQTRADQLDMQNHMSAFDFASEGDYYFGWDLDTGEMLRYDMSTPYDLSSGPGTTPSQRESMDGITTQDLSGLIVSVDGLTMWGLIQGGTEIWQWTLNTAYDLTGGTTKSGTFTLNSTASSNPYGMFSPKDRNEIWICWNTNPRIESYVWT